MSIDSQALATEITTDPAALGYAAPLAAGADQALADILNLVRTGVTFKIDREPITAAAFLAQCSSTEFLALTQLKLSQLSTVFAAQMIDINDVSTQAILLGIFPAAGTTKANIQAILKRNGSRAEVLFGRGAIVTADDIARARG